MLIYYSYSRAPINIYSDRMKQEYNHTFSQSFSHGIQQTSTLWLTFDQEPQHFTVRSRRQLFHCRYLHGRWLATESCSSGTTSGMRVRTTESYAVDHSGKWWDSVGDNRGERSTIMHRRQQTIERTTDGFDTTSTNNLLLHNYTQKNIVFEHLYIYIYNFYSIIDDCYKAMAVLFYRN